MEGRKSTVFCIECGVDREYKILTRRTAVEVRGVHFSYLELVAVCEGCGEELYVPEVNDANVQAQEDAYRKAAGIITVQEIHAILKKYDIGARPLAKLMGYGEVTVNRYVAGQLPSRQHSEELLKVLASHKEMERRLEAHADEMTIVAQKKCRVALDQLGNLYSDEKIGVVARYLLNKAGEITPMALQKLLYYAQAFFKVLFGADLFKDRCQAWAHGPVFPEVYYKYRKYGYDPIEKPLQTFDEDQKKLTIREIEFLDAIISAFGCYSGKTLERITHAEKPWIVARGDLLPEDRSTTELDEEIMYNYFKSVVEEYRIVNPCDITRYSKKMSKQILC